MMTCGLRYGHKEAGNSLSGMVKHSARAHLPPLAFGAQFRGVSVTYDGTIIYITDNGEGYLAKRLTQIHALK